jgi:hypothetical protein
LPGSGFVFVSASDVYETALSVLGQNQHQFIIDHPRRTVTETIDVRALSLTENAVNYYRAYLDVSPDFMENGMKLKIHWTNIGPNAKI